MINIIWQTEYSNKPVITNETSIQFEYITKVLFKNVEHINYFDNKEYKTILDNSIIIFPNRIPSISDEMKEYLNKFHLLKYNYILFHLGDEIYHDNYDYYSNAKHVFRFYYNKDIKFNNVTTPAMGFISGYMNNGETINLSKYRDISVTFIGELKHDRQLLVNSISNIKNNFIHCTRSWGDPNQIPIKNVIDIYKKTLFVPIPKGYDDRGEGCRPYEALEWGCIPILKTVNGVDFYRHVLGEHPLPTVDNWSDIKSLIDKLMNDDVDSLIIKVNNWWTTFKEKLSNNIGDIVNEKLKNNDK
jgi:hypothetical protein